MWSSKSGEANEKARNVHKRPRARADRLVISTGHCARAKGLCASLPHLRNVEACIPFTEVIFAFGFSILVERVCRCFSRCPNDVLCRHLTIDDRWLDGKKSLRGDAARSAVPDDTDEVMQVETLAGMCVREEATQTKRCHNGRLWIGIVVAAVVSLYIGRLRYKVEFAFGAHVLHGTALLEDERLGGLLRLFVQASLL